MSLLTLSDIKKHARVTITDDDDLIQSKIDAAESWVGSYLGADLSTFIVSPATTLPEPLQEAVRQLVSFLYDNREAAIVGNTVTVTDVSPGFYDLMAPYRTYVF